VVISDPEHLQVFYTSTKMIDRSRMYEAGHETLGKDSLLIANGILLAGPGRLVAAAYRRAPV